MKAKANLIFLISIICGYAPSLLPAFEANAPRATALSIAEASPELAAQFSLDSARRAIQLRILTPTDKKEIRACDREKTEFLKQCRASEPASLELDRKLNEAKLGGANPNDPAIQALLEKKFLLEKTCDDRYNATARGKQCLSGEQKRQSALNQALAGDKDYQKLRKRSQTAPSQPL